MQTMGKAHSSDYINKMCTLYERTQMSNLIYSYHTLVTRAENDQKKWQI